MVVPFGIGLAAIPTRTPDAGGAEFLALERGAPGPVPTADWGSSNASGSNAALVAVGAPKDSVAVGLLIQPPDAACIVEAAAP